jgi:hypothetical protein
MPEPYSVGWVSATGGVVAPSSSSGTFVDPHFELADPGADGKPGRANYDDDGLNGVDDVGELGWPGTDDIPRVERLGNARIRFGSAGALYQITGVNAGATPYPTLTVPTAPAVPAGTSYQIFNPPTPLPGVAPITLPDGIIIDVRHSPIRRLQFPHPFAGNRDIDVPRSRGIPNQIPPGAMATFASNVWPNMEILFAPTGNVTGIGAQRSIIHFWVGERGDKGPDPRTSLGSDGIIGTLDDSGPTRPHYLMTLNTRTGSVLVFQNPGTASVDPWPPVASPASDYAEIYAPAEQSLGLSKLILP